jgi:predicted acylesterase/phospholipase RssA
MRPLGEIALCLSGGGFRAAGFHLGALDALARLGLAGDVRVLSTASGGTLVGAAWALALARGQRPEDFFRDTYDGLRLLQLPEKVGPALERMSGPRSLARAVARIYDRHLYGGASFADLLDAAGPLAGLEVAFNATELRHGLPFRFQRGGWIGNARVTIAREDAARLRVADVAAASACFPGGFEPLVLPDDFEGLGPGARVVREDGRPPDATPLALVDGGIDDNQAIDSALLAILRRRRTAGGARAPVLVIASDTTPRPYPPLDPAPRPAGRGWPTLGQLAAALVAVPAAGAAAIALHAAIAAARGRLGASELLLAVPLAALLAALAAGVAIRRWAVARLAAAAPGLDPRLLRAALGLGLAEAWAALRDRARSLQAIASSVFAARVRRLVYARLWGDPAFAGRRLANLIYDLARPDAAADLPAGLAPTEALRALADRANAIPTTLWFDHPDQLRDLAAAGQATLCFNVIQHLHRSGRLDAPATEEEAALAGAVRALWTTLRSDPYAALRDRLEPARWPAATSAAGKVRRVFGA